MDDSCVVCAEALDWVAYGQCGHREVCSTCVARLRFICDDRNCCLCKSKLNVVFVTKALGDYTRVIVDFSVFPSEPKEGKVGSYWYHEDTQAFFDDSDHYKMIKAMCKLSCLVCDKLDEQGNHNSRRRVNYKNVEQLKDHLIHHHKLFMCNLCLEGRKIFVCEQKLYDEEQLHQHINMGNSEVDGSEAERGGFKGHPMCDFCQNPFYGESELYTHMSTEHYTCHICKRQHVGHYEYYRNYDELEIHFRRDHILCEDEGCLAKKFIVFSTESEMKRHNAMEHGGRMSRSKRNAALQITTSFRYERSIDQDRRQRGHGFHSEYSESELLTAVQASLETSNANLSHATSHVETVPNFGEAAEINSRFRPLELLASTGSLPSSRYHIQQEQTSRNTPLEELSFPPLPVSTRSNQQNSRNKSKGLGKNTMAARLRRSNHVAVLHSSHNRTQMGRQPTASTSNVSKLSSTLTTGNASSSSSASSSLSKPANGIALVARNNSSSGNSNTQATHEHVSASSERSSSNSIGLTKVNHSASAPNLMDRGAFDCSKALFPPVSVMNKKQLTTTNQHLVKVEDAQAANKSLVEKIRAGLQFDNDRYGVFKVISGEYRQNLIETGEYVAYVHQFGLSHLLCELARLCPDARKQKELLEACNSNMGSSGDCLGKNSWLDEKIVSQKGKEKLKGFEISSKPGSTDSILCSARELHSSDKSSAEEVEILSKDGYRSAKGKSKFVAVDVRTSSSSIEEKTSQHDLASAGGSSKKNVGGNKPRKKTSKFHRARLGEDSPAAVLGLAISESSPDPSLEKPSSHNGPRKLPVGGVWSNGGGRKLVSNLR